MTTTTTAYNVDDSTGTVLAAGLTRDAAIEGDCGTCEPRPPRYHAVGSVRGSCGHQHRTIAAAGRCVQRDKRGCRSLGGGAYSDRSVARIDGAALTDDELAELDALVVS